MACLLVWRRSLVPVVAARFGLCDAEAGANDAGEDVAGLRVPLAERATGRKLCGVPDEAVEDDCVDRLAECETLERAGCEAGEKLGIDGEPDFGGIVGFVRL